MPAEVLTCRYNAQTHPGLLRENNEDAFSIDEPTGVAVLADGMGGYNAGEIASSMAATLISKEMARWLALAGDAASVQDIRRALEICVSNANYAVYKAANENSQYAGMGTTLVAGVFRANNLVLGHIGDSRCYRMRAGVMVQLTRDHSLLQEQIDAGLLTPEQAAQSLNKNLVTRALGVEESVLLEVHEYRAEPGDLYLMCSDGLSDMVNDQDIAAALRQEAPLAERAGTLVQLANARGGRDNITVLLVETEAEAERRGLMARLLGK